MTKSQVTGRDVSCAIVYSCGSFQFNGYLGTHDDKLTHAYLLCHEDGRTPTRLIMSGDVLRGYLTACYHGNRPNVLPHKATVDVMLSYFARSMVKRKIEPPRFFDATIDVDTTTRGQCDFYFGDVLVAETSGWILP